MSGVLEVLRDTAVAAVLLGVVFYPLEWAFPAQPGQGWRRPKLALDAAFFLGNYLVWGALAVAALESLSRPLGELLPLAARAAFARQSWWAQAAAVVVLGDLGIYWFHRACHAWEPLWRIHRVHHSAEHLDWVAAHREHPLDGLLSQLVLNLPALALGFSVEVVGTFFVFRGLWSIFIHSNCRVPLGPLRYLLGAPEVHAWHHARNPGRVANFANLAPWCDLLFGTYHCPDADEVWEIGVPEPMPQSYLGMLVAPFVQRRWRLSLEVGPIVTALAVGLAVSVPMPAWGGPTCASGCEDLSGVVSTNAGAGVADATIIVASLDDFDGAPLQAFNGRADDAAYEQLLDPATRSQSDGGWVIRCVCAGRVQVAAHHQSFADGVVEGSTRSPMRVVLERGGSLRGVVVGNSGEPVRGAKLSFQRIAAEADLVTSLDRALTAVSGDRGSFASPKLADGQYRIHAYVSAYRRGSEVAVLRKGVGPPIRIALREGRISGRALKSDGSAAPGAIVRAVSEDIRESMRRARCGSFDGAEGQAATADQNGFFELSGLPLWDRYWVSAGIDGYYATGVPNVSPGTRNLQLTLEPDKDSPGNATVRGRLVGAGDAGAWVELTARSASDTGQRVVSDFAFARVAAGSTSVFAFADGRAAVEIPFSVPEAGAVDLGEIPLLPERPFRVHVVDGVTAETIRDPSLILDHPLWSNAQQTHGKPIPLSRPRGRITFQGLASGVVSGTVRADGYAVGRFTAGPLQEEIEVRLVRLPSLQLAWNAPDSGVTSQIVTFAVGNDWYRPTRVVGVTRTTISIAPGSYVVVSGDPNWTGELPDRFFFPEWVEVGTDGGSAFLGDAVDGATLRVRNAIGEGEDVGVGLVRGENSLPQSSDGWNALRGQLLPTQKHGRSGVTFPTVRSGRYTLITTKGKTGRDGTDEILLWSKIVDLPAGVTTVDLGRLEEQKAVRIAIPFAGFPPAAPPRGH